MSPSYCINELWYKPFMWRRADVRLWRVLVPHFRYKPFMWCRSDVRLRHALSLLSVISPLCGVAPTPDCGIIIPHFPLEESFRHSFGTRIIIPHFPLEESFRHSFGTRIIISHFPLEESFRHSFGTRIIIFAFSARGVFQTLAWHPVFYFELFLPHVCIMVFVSIRDRRVTAY